jgi:ZIP family zinc transporter
MLGGLAGFSATALGAVPALFLRGIGQRTEDMMLGMAAGMMLAASSFSLILPGLGAAAVVVGMGLGTLLMPGLDEFIPHTHLTAGSHGPGSQRFGGHQTPATLGLMAGFAVMMFLDTALG